MSSGPRVDTAGYAVLAFAYLNIVLLLANYNIPWVQPEEFNWREHILTNGTSLLSQDLLNGLDWKTFEYEPRITRPLSHEFEILDTKFRTWLWKFVIPHPSLSLTWVFLLGVSPLLLFRLLRNLGVATALAGMITALYLANPGTLSLAVVDFRPAKPLANCAILCCLYWASIIHNRNASHSGAAEKQLGSFGPFCAFMFVSFFLDETALLSFPAVLLLFPRVVLRNSRRLVTFSSLPLLTYFAYTRWIPGLTVWAGFEFPDMLDYGPAASVTGWNAVQTVIAPQILRDLPLNLSIFLSDSLGLVNPKLTHSWGYWILWVGVGAFMAFVIANMLRVLLKNREHVGERWSVRSILHGNVTVLRSFAVLMTVTFFANVLLHVVENRIWGLYWLNSFWPIFFLIFFALVLQKLHLSRIVVALGICVTIAASIYNFTYVNNAFKQFFYYRAVVFEDVLLHKVNRFDIPLRTDSLLFAKTYSIWTRHQNSSVIPAIPTELYYLVHDLRLIERGTTKATRWAVFDGNVLEFDLVRRQDYPTNAVFDVIPSKRRSN